MSLHAADKRGEFLPALEVWDGRETIISSTGF